mmetsp:Transcript_19098/g.40454  ORF Transcript_19098/g.40454 Transcript_19098/m.40454 type:complete len:86 (+) Transcript_19098:13-270(+)|eukprot:1662573-Pleurochrysis_carterae.AAC.1
MADAATHSFARNAAAPEHAIENGANLEGSNASAPLWQIQQELQSLASLQERLNSHSSALQSQLRAQRSILQEMDADPCSTPSLDR